LKRNPFIKGRGHLVQKAAKKYWDEELGGDIKKVTEYTKSKKKRTCWRTVKVWVYKAEAG
jgi:hypothetical protein